MTRMDQWLTRLCMALMVGALAVFLYGYWAGYDLSIGWHVTTTAESEPFVAHTFSKGPFSFDITGEKYTLVETYSAGPVQRHYAHDYFFLALTFLGICILLAASTYLSRLWFTGICALFIVFLSSLQLQALGLFGFAPGTSIGLILLLVAYVVPLYVVHAFFEEMAFVWRILIPLAASGAVVLLGGLSMPVLADQLIAGSYFGLVILGLLFLLLIAEEVIFGILYLITQSKGGRNNHVHFMVFSTIYLALIGAYYAKKAGLITLELAYMNPFVLMAVSSGLLLWSLRHKTHLFGNLITTHEARWLISGMGIAVFAFMGHAFFRGNDPVYEGLHFFIIYTHLGFGFFFFAYILLNFITPLTQGLQVYRITYQSQNFPYISAKIGGIVCVAAFFFLAEKKPFLIFQAGKFNYLAAQEAAKGEEALAQRLLRESAVYGQDNHFANYQLGYVALQRNDLKQSNYRFGRAASRYPSAQAFVNQAGTYAMLQEPGTLTATLKSGLQEFPGNGILQNNLGLAYADAGNNQAAAAVFLSARNETGWSDAHLVNYWKVSESIPDADNVTQNFTDAQLPLKTNIISRLLETDQQLLPPFDTAWVYPAYPLHRQAFLINANWYYDGQPDALQELDKALTGAVVEESFLQNARYAQAIGAYLSGQPQRAIARLQQMAFDGPNRGYYYHSIGLLALAQHAPALALEYFEKAIAEGHEAALTTKAATLMELGRWTEADQFASYLESIDTSYTALAADIRKLASGDPPGEALQLHHLYYFYQTYSSAAMSSLLAQAESGLARSLWQKIVAEQSTEHATELEIVFRQAIKDESLFVDFAIRKKLAAGTLNELATVLNSAADTSAIVPALVQFAQRNILNAPLVAIVAGRMESLSLTDSYDLLVNALEVNPYDVSLHKMYILSAVKMGLLGYAAQALDKLQAEVPASELSGFLAAYDEAVKAREQAGW